MERQGKGGAHTWHPAPRSDRKCEATTGSALGLLFLLLTERGTQDVAQAGAAIRGAEFSHGLLLVLDLQCLDRQGQPPAGRVDIDDLGIDLLACRVALRPLLVAVAGELDLADEARGAAGGLDLDAACIDLLDRAGHPVALLDARSRLPERVLAQLLDAERDALLLDVDIEHLGTHHVALVVLLDGFLAGELPVQVGEVHHAVDVVVEADEQAELGDVADLALDDRARGMCLDEGFPGITQALLEAEADPALLRVDLEHHDLDLLGGGHDLAGVRVLLGPAHLGDVDQAFHARLQLDEGAVVGDVGHASGELRTHRVLELDALPGIRLELLHAQADALRLAVEADDLDTDVLADA